MEPEKKNVTVLYEIQTMTKNGNSHGARMMKEKVAFPQIFIFPNVGCSFPLRRKGRNAKSTYQSVRKS